MFIKAKNKFVTPIYTTVNPKNDDFDTVQGVEVINVKEIWSPEIKNITSFIPERYLKDFYMTLMTIVEPIIPHTHTDLYTVLNFYITCNNSKTSFYEAKDSMNLKIIESSDNYDSYDESELDEVGHFIAQNNDVYLLDASKIHSVKPLSEWSKRKIISMRTDKHTFSNVCEMLKETGNL